MKITKILLIALLANIFASQAQSEDVFERVYKMKLYAEDKEIIDSLIDLMFSDYTGGAPIYILALNVLIALLFTPIHKVIETKMKKLVVK